MLADALAYLFPVPCAGCGREGRSLCAACAEQLAAWPTTREVAGLPVTAGLAYDGVARAALLALKEQGATTLASRLAPAFAAAVSSALERAPDAVLVTVPSSRAARRRRGYEPVRMLAAAAGIRITPVFAPAEPHAAQKTLSADERAHNLAGVFRLARPVTDVRVLLLDDVVTTGATLSAAAEAIRAGGGRVAGAAVLAVTERRHAGSTRTPRVTPGSSP